MNLTWLGHACFLLEQDGFRIAVDPYTGVDGYPDLQVRAHQTACSHGHHDHSAAEQVTLLPEPKDSPFSIRRVGTFHDDQNGALRGDNAVQIFTAGSVTAVHLGDLGHQLTPEQAAAIGPADVLLVPVGGYYTIDAQGAKAVCDCLRPRCVVPMHYYHPPYGIDRLASVEDFLSLWPAAAVHRLEGPALELTPDCAGVYVPRFGG